MVDGITVGVATGGMRLRFLTVATDAIEKTDYRLMAESKGNEAIVVLADTPYYESLESAMKIRKYVKQRNVSQLPKTVQKIISDQQDEAGKYELSAMSELQNAIEGAQFYVDGEHLETKAGNAKSKIDQSLEYLVAHVYSKIDLITDNAGSDADIIAILTGAVTALPGMEPNRDAASAMEEYLEMQDAKKLPTSMADVQSKYSAIPYGWKEIDIAAVAAQLIYSQKVTIKYAGNTIQPDDPKLPDMLRKKSEIGKTSISKRKNISATMMRDVKAMLREYFDIMDVPDDEDGLIRFVTEKFTEQRDYYASLDARYDGHKYPDRALVQEAIHLMDDVLSQKKDNIALIERVLKKEDALFDNKEAMSNGIENFFKTQVTVFDQAVQFEKSLHDDLDRIKRCVEYGRRYAIMQKGVQPDYLMPVKFLGGNTEFDGFAPRESIRIKMNGGGMNFVHGGISLQEMVVPVIEYHYLRNDSMEYKRNKQKYDTKPVTVNLLSANRKISNMIFSLNFYQKDAVSTNREAATYQVYFTDEDGKQISDIQKIIADKTSDNGAERTFRCQFNLKSLKYSNTATYYLVIADEQGLQMPQREPFQIDIAFAVDEFDFFS